MGAAAVDQIGSAAKKLLKTPDAPDASTPGGHACGSGDGSSSRRVKTKSLPLAGMAVHHPPSHPVCGAAKKLLKPTRRLDASTPTDDLYRVFRRRVTVGRRVACQEGRWWRQVVGCVGCFREFPPTPSASTPLNHAKCANKHHFTKLYKCPFGPLGEAIPHYATRVLGWFAHLSLSIYLIKSVQTQHPNTVVCLRSTNQVGEIWDLSISVIRFRPAVMKLSIRSVKILI